MLWRKKIKEIWSIVRFCKSQNTIKIWNCEVWISVKIFHFLHTILFILKKIKRKWKDTIQKKQFGFGLGNSAIGLHKQTNKKTNSNNQAAITQTTKKTPNILVLEQLFYIFKISVTQKFANLQPYYADL